ncbi:cyclic nucleotide-binding domain-containing protein [Chondromyces crocatus]|uniref:Cyclic nucleotide-binding domain-containing protein n=1 Tax=Chondromyces crocatus TaxID=52 RepID=A0A0K1E6X5_CHOCO|nr:cyclic nucleotide-binding domain-containing protein [Chondromyces crocatus]AKT36594.1 uncharacterized protein CMC5_007120 [Chondromyces crocatus]
MRRATERPEEKANAEPSFVIDAPVATAPPAQVTHDPLPPKTDSPTSSSGSAPRSLPDCAPTEQTDALTAADLANVDAFADLPEEMHEQLARATRVEQLTMDEEVAGFGVALVLAGEASVCTSIVDTPAIHATPHTLVPSRGTLTEGVPLRVVAGAEGARVAVWDQDTIDIALRTCPWVVDDLREVADRLQAFAGATIGPLGDLDDDQLRHVLERLRVQLLKPGEVFLLSGHPVPGLAIIGAGTVELLEKDDEPPTAAARPGDILFASALLSGQQAPATARAAASGALLLIAEHRTLRSLFEEVPALIQLLSAEL